MAETLAVRGFGLILSYGDGATPTETFTPVKTVMDLLRPEHQP